ncbi:MAG TPA: methyl-accepting chemotaxis protein [Burkholderiaceae bacterium]
MFQNLSFKRKIGALVGVSVLGLCVFAAVSFVRLRDSIVDGRKAQLVAAVTSARSIAAAYQQMAASGAMPVAEAQKAAEDALRGLRYGAAHADYIYIFTSKGDSVMHPIKKEWVGHNIIGQVKDADGFDVIQGVVDAANKSADGTGFVMTMFPRPGQTAPVPKLQYVESVKDWDWVVGSGVYTDDVDAQVLSALYGSLAVAAALLLGIGGIGFLVARSVLNQIGGDPSEALRAMDEVARGDLSASVRTEVPGSLLAGLAQMIASLRSTVSQLRHATDSIATASGQIAAGNHDLSSRTEQTASNLQQTAASMEELTGTVKQTSDSARKANELASSATDAAARGGQVVSQVVSTMDEINASSRRIGDIIGVIDGIAFQTNILALNAAVEAARAGEHGRGFAVVASEVRSLAQRSAGAAKEIKSLIAASVERVDSGSQLVAAAGASMTDIVSSVNRVSAIIGEITHAATEQSSGIGQINGAVSQLDQMTQQNAALVEESAAAAESLKAQARRLSDVVEVFRLER